MSKHTPGPWRWDEDFYGLYSGNEREPVLQWEPYEGMRLEYHMDGKREANGYLIAAAPDLLEACEAHISALGSKIRDGKDRPEYREAIYQAYKKMVDAIARARGESK